MRRFLRATDAGFKIETFLVSVSGYPPYDVISGFKLPEDFDMEIPFDLHFDPYKRIKLEISLENSDGYFNIDNCRVIVQDMKDRPGPRTQPEYITSTTWGCTLPHCGYKDSCSVSNFYLPELTD